MKEPEYKIWIRRAKDDLKWTTANIKEKIFYGACFTAQQAVEKALKAYLIFKQGRFGKVHDLVKLINDCAKFDKEFLAYKEAVANLSFYYIESRYPDIYEIDRFTKKEAEEALKIAKEVVDFVASKL